MRGCEGRVSDVQNELTRLPAFADQTGHYRDGPSILAVCMLRPHNGEAVASKISLICWEGRQKRGSVAC